MPKLYSYVVARDYGFAPNPFYGFCTLATCKPQIRKKAAVGDWIIGTGSKSEKRDRYLVYAMRVSEVMSFNEYWQDLRFREKCPDMYASIRKAFGDNIYYRDNTSNEWHQIDSHHSNKNGTQNHKNVRHDTQIDRVLISDDFIYWGGSGPRIPAFSGVDICKRGPSHKCHFPKEIVKDCIAWLRSLNETGYCGVPLEWECRSVSDDKASSRLGFMARQIEVPDDFDSMGGPEIEKMFGGDA